jgi:hypothetical protein
MNKCYTVTFGDVAENHVGMQQIGVLATNGYLPEQLYHLYEQLSEFELECKIINLSDHLPKDLVKQSAKDLVKQSAKDLVKQSAKDLVKDALVLVIRRGVQYILQTEDTKLIMDEHDELPMDKKALMNGKVVNKQARYNLCFSEEDQEPNYELGRGRIISYERVSLTNRIREQIAIWTEDTLLNGEANYYYNIKKCGIGYHGDSERRKVFAFRMGASMPLYFQWYLYSNPIGEKIKIELDDGDMYVMSQDAVGHDWKNRIIPTLRHATGCDKYTNH